MSRATIIRRIQKAREAIEDGQQFRARDADPGVVAGFFLEAIAHALLALIGDQE